MVDRGRVYVGSIDVHVGSTRRECGTREGIQHLPQVAQVGGVVCVCVCFFLRHPKLDC